MFTSSLTRGTPVAGLMLLYPCVEFKTVERDALHPDRDHRKPRPDLGVEPVAVHAEVGGGVAQAQQAAISAQATAARRASQELEEARRTANVSSQSSIRMATGIGIAAAILGGIIFFIAHRDSLGSSIFFGLLTGVCTSIAAFRQDRMNVEKARLRTARAVFCPECSQGLHFFQEGRLECRCPRCKTSFVLNSDNRVFDIQRHMR